MRLTLSTGRTFIIKVRYRTEDKVKIQEDQYHRKVTTTWKEHNTVVAIDELKEHANTACVYKGYAYCSYKDTFSKKVGREIAYYNAVTAMLRDGVITEEESYEMDNFALNTWVQVNPKKVETKNVETKTEDTQKE